MDPAVISAIIGACIVITGIVGLYACDKCKQRRKEIYSPSNPLLVRKKSFKVKDLFKHVEF